MHGQQNTKKLCNTEARSDLFILDPSQMVVALLHCGHNLLLLLLFIIKPLFLSRGKDILMVQVNDKKAENRASLFPIPRSTKGDDSFFPNTKFSRVLSSFVILADTLLLPDL